MKHAFATALFATLLALSPLPSALSSAINIPVLIDRLCYRYPSPLVDAIVEHDAGKRLVAVKNVTVNEEFFQGHFPGAPVMPAVLMLESWLQVATCLLLQREDAPPVGAGEAAMGPTAAAIGNAVCDALGVRVRDLPITPERFA